MGKSEAQREAAVGLLRASLSAKGLQLTRDIMRLNHTLGELNNNNFEKYGEWLYWITVMGSPSAKEPWGWQLDGHHAIINYSVLGDQVVMTPFFVGSEPVIAHAGKFRGVEILKDEQRKALTLINALTACARQLLPVLEVSARICFGSTTSNIPIPIERSHCQGFREGEAPAEPLGDQPSTSDRMPLPAFAI